MMNALGCPPTGTELAQIRADVAGLLDQSAVIQRKTRVTDGYGTGTETLTTIGTVAASLKQPAATLLQNYDYLVASQRTWHVNLPDGTDCRQDDILTIGGRTMTVQVILTPQSYSVYVAALCAEVG